MRRIAPYLLIVFSIILSGCVAAAAGAGAAAGSSMQDEDVRDLEYWLKTNDATTRIGVAMQNREIVEGMTPTHVKLVMPAKGRYDALPTSRDTTDGQLVWTYVPQIDNFSTYKIYFEEERVVRFETQETDEDDGIEGPRGN